MEALHGYPFTRAGRHLFFMDVYISNLNSY
jgi:hypothetical protein